MFMLRNLGKALFGDGNKQDVISIDQGQLYIVRPDSPKGYSECIFKDSVACIRRTSTPYHYQLVIQRAYEEGEEQLIDDAEDADDLKDEKIFLLDESIKFRSLVKEGESVFAWRDLSGDSGDVYEFVVDPSIDSTTVANFSLVAVQCQYERKYRKAHTEASEKELEEFSFQESPIPPASPGLSPISSPSRSGSGTKLSGTPRKFKEPEPLELPSPTPSEPDSDSPDAQLFAEARSEVKSEEKADAKVETKAVAQTDAPKAVARPSSGEDLCEEEAELHLYDINSGTFVLKAPSVLATVSDIGHWSYWLDISDKEDGKCWLGTPVIADLNPVFNFEYFSFIFNYFAEDGIAYSWLLRFKDTESLDRFQEGLMRALWEQLNETKWLKAKDQDRDYVLEAFQEDIEMLDAEEGEEEEEEEDEEADRTSEHYDSDEEYDDVAGQPEDGDVNSQLAVGYKHDRSFVVRGDKIGVFKHTPNNKIEFATTINKIKTPGGLKFAPTKVMLHQQDSNMIMQREGDPHTLYKMDLEYGKVVDEWKVHDDIPVHTFTPDSKFAQMTGEETFLGISNNALFRIDPRLAGQKLVDSQLKQYVSKNDFSAAATTEKGYIAVASNKGDIRLFDRLGINAKTHIPALGEPIIGLDVSADGRWILATCKTYLLLIDAEQKDGKNAGKLGFEKSFAKDSKPRPRRLGLNPSHVAQMQHETKQPLSFTVAKFNTGLDAAETTIVTSTGPFVVTWNLKKVQRAQKDPYTIKRYQDEVKADNFKFGSDKNVIVALPNEIEMVKRETFKKPTRESFAVGRRQGRSRVVEEY
ncbi:VID27-domain-containing protein [Ascobolus immersus RN42]|uniref:VID27-domain-containing protein n=1 Tax=Ascobolus immersus RN42 TaxID=1160509 RepID=A0A3N4HF95_ASCIM|nr:VID27-domain-containing protein [Ascobolus immersus RN42]